MRILVSGSTGFIGSSLVSFLTTGGHDITRLTRKISKISGDNVVYWSPIIGEIDSEGIEGHDVIVHLAGENIASRWTSGKKAEIENSRVIGTKLLSDTIVNLRKKPSILVCASAIGYYGDRGDELLNEESASGKGFLAELSQQWEKQTESLMKEGIRVVLLRTGVVLSPKGGALKKMLLPFQLGLGGTIGSGEQYISWISMVDAIGAIYHVIMNESLSGPVNIVSPNPLTNYEFTKTLGKVLVRPTIIHVPTFALRIMFGEMADEALLSSTRVEPLKLLKSGFKFEYPVLEDALRYLLRK